MGWQNFLSSVMLFILLVLFGLASFLLYESYYSETQFFDISIIEDNSPIVNITISDDYPNGILFYDTLRFPTNKISYSLEPICNENRVSNTRDAFNILQENTVLVFTEKENGGDIQVICSETNDVPEGEYFIAGEGGPNSIINATNYYIVNNGTIFLYRDTKCSKPVVAIHEILHVLGFTHSTNKKSIMYEVSDCNQKITSEIIEAINVLYSIPSRPDLIVAKASAEKKGRYVNFNIEILNAGLDFSSPTQFSILADGEEITSYEVDGLDAGTGRIITVSNLKVPRMVNELSFFVDFEFRVSEINEDNNEVVLVLNS